MNKVIRNGKVAVLISAWYGAGWGWCAAVGAAAGRFDPEIVEMVENDQYDRIIPYCEKTYGQDGYYAGAPNLKIEWVDLGTEFLIHEYDGWESIWKKSEIEWLTA